MLARRLLGAANKATPLEYVGSNSKGWPGATTGNNTISLTALTGGIASAAQAGDLVIAAYAVGSTASTTVAITDGTNNYTLIGSQLYSNSSYDTSLRIAYKQLTAADADVTFGPTTNGSFAGAGVVHVWRGVNASSPFDVTQTTATGTGHGRPDPAAITPVTSGAKIIVIGASSQQTTAAFTAAYLSGFRQQGSTDTYDATLGIGYVDWTSGTYDPAAFTAGSSGTTNSWAAMTLALRPA